MSFLYMQKKLWAEFLGTYCLLFAGTGAIIINDISGGSVTHVGIALTFGLIVFAMIAALGDVSGAHLNPAVTVGLFLAGRFPGPAVIPYVVSQLIGAVVASTTLLALFPQHPTLGGTLPTGSAVQSLLLEILITALLMFVILSVTAGDKVKKITAGMAIGSTIALAAIFAGPVSGASMNPARSLAPALITGQLDALWIYLAGPVLGAVLGVMLCRCTREGCCQIPLKEKGRQ
ncbi:MAG: aquaporin [Syntrophomonadaceae bacterium]|nr:aquaporin [Syntrophomonadaceae bacterium]